MYQDFHDVFLVQNVCMLASCLDPEGKGGGRGGGEQGVWTHPRKSHHHRPTSVTAFKWHFVGRYQHPLPQKNLKVLGPSLTKLSGSVPGSKVIFVKISQISFHSLWHVRYSGMLLGYKLGKLKFILRETHQWFIYNLGPMSPGTRCFQYQWVPTASLWVQTTILHNKSAILLHPGTRRDSLKEKVMLKRCRMRR